MTAQVAGSGTAYLRAIAGDPEGVERALEVGPAP
jgi:hypothetical protein